LLCSALRTDDLEVRAVALGAERPVAPPDQLAPAGAVPAGPGDGLEQHLADGRVVQGVVEDAADPALPASLDVGEHGVGGLGGDPPGLLALGEVDRQHVLLGLALGVVDADDDQPQGGIVLLPDVDHVGDAGGEDLARLAAEPALPVQDRRQHGLEPFAPPALEQRRPLAGDGQLGGFGGGLDGQRLGRLAHLGQRQAARLAFQREPEELVGAEGQLVGLVGDRRERGPPEHLDRGEPLELLQRQGGRLRVAGQVRDHEDPLFGAVRVGPVPADVGEHLRVVGVDELDGPTTEQGGVPLAERDQPSHPPQQRRRVLLLGLDVDGLVVVLGVDDDGEVEPLGVRVAEPGVAVGGPLHRGADPVAVPEPDVVAHADLVAVVDHRRPRHGEQQRVHQLDQPPVVAEQRREPATDPEVDAHPRVVGVGAVHEVPLLVRHHLERELVVVAQEQRPLGPVGDLRGLLEDVDDGEAVLLADPHEQPRHQREVEVHVALVAVAEVGGGVLGPLVGLGEEHAAGPLLVEVAAELLEVVVGLRQVLAVGALALVEVGDRVEPEPVHAGLGPEVEHLGERSCTSGLSKLRSGWWL
jgi:hypothetical protein